VQTSSARLCEDVCGAFDDAPLHDDSIADEEDHALQLSDLPDFAPGPSSQPDIPDPQRQHSSCLPTPHSPSIDRPFVPALPIRVLQGYTQCPNRAVAEGADAANLTDGPAEAGTATAKITHPAGNTVEPADIVSAQQVQEATDRQQLDVASSDTITEHAASKWQACFCTH